MIPIVFITDKNFMLPVGVAVYTLLTNKKADTLYDIYVIMVDSTEEDSMFFNRINTGESKINFLYVSTEKYACINQLAHISRAGLVKFEIAELLPEYDRVIYLDADIMIRSDLSDLYDADLGDAVIGGVKSLDMVYDDTPMINSGVMIINTQMFRDGAYSQKLLEKRIELGDRRSMDQQVINIVFKDKIAYLPVKYNCVAEKILGNEKKRYPIAALNEIYASKYENNDRLVDDAVIIHYATTMKPWKYTFVICGDEWYGMYSKSPYNTETLKRLTRSKSMINGAITRFKKDGIKGVIERINEKIKDRTKGVEYEKWG